MKREKIILSVAAIGALASCSGTNQAPNLRDFNVIYILADDLGYGDLGCYGQTLIKTPNIDRMAAQGMRFTQHYAGCTVSAPSRSSLMTGLHTGHTFIRGNKQVTGKNGEEIEGQYPIPADTYTLSRMFKEAGYATGAFGKWGLGSPGSEGDPTYQGFDEFFGYNCQAMAHKYYPQYLWHNRDTVWLEGNDTRNMVTYSADLIHAEALKFIEQHRHEKFFAYLAYTLPHAEVVAPDDSILQQYNGKFEERPFVSPNGGNYGIDFNYSSYMSQPKPYANFAAMISRLDMYVGQVMEQVKALGLEGKTLIIFTSDNGPHKEGGANPDFFKSYGPLRGVKRDLYEGGIRVPMIARCPGVIAENSVNDMVSTFWDMMPTFAAVTGTKLSRPTDGISIIPTLTGAKGQQQHDFLYWEFHEMGGKIAVRMGDWKGIRLNVMKNPNAPLELYDLSTDIHEDHNVAADHPDIVAKIEKIMRDSHTPSAVFKFTEKSGEI